MAAHRKSEKWLASLGPLELHDGVDHVAGAAHLDGERVHLH